MPGWPFSNCAAPNLDNTPGQAVPTSSTAIAAGQAWLMGAHFTNTGAVQRTITVTDTAGNTILVLVLAAGLEQSYEWPFRPTLGLKWFASGVGIVGHVWGYQ
jgi:hypothetical protein